PNGKGHAAGRLSLVGSLHSVRPADARLGAGELVGLSDPGRSLPVARLPQSLVFLGSDGARGVHRLLGRHPLGGSQRPVDGVISCRTTIVRWPCSSTSKTSRSAFRADATASKFIAGWSGSSETARTAAKRPQPT